MYLLAKLPTDKEKNLKLRLCQSVNYFQQVLCDVINGWIVCNVSFVLQFYYMSSVPTGNNNKTF